MASLMSPTTHLYNPLLIIKIQERMVERGCCELLPGLSEDEIKRIETKFSFIFPPETREFLQIGVPVDPASSRNGKPAEEYADPFNWHNWRWLLREGEHNQ